jgi:soluble lytic murein transglycosylase-like protein
MIRLDTRNIERVQSRIREIRDLIGETAAARGRADGNSFAEILAAAESGKKEEKKVGQPRAEIPGLLRPVGDGASKESWDQAIRDCAKKYGVEESLVRAVMAAESGGRPDAVSPKGAIGLMQLMPGTAIDMGIDDPFDPGQNIEGGVKYLSLLADKYEGDLERTLAAYNAGPARVDAAGGIPSIPETQRYVENVMARYRRLKGGG